MRDIIEIDEEKCNGCGQCILACAEGALELVDGKARLVGDILCDGLGACMGECPEGALKIIKKDTVEFDEEAVKKHLAKLNKDEKAPLDCGCPGSAAMSLSPMGGPAAAAGPSALSHWPVKLRLVQPDAPFLKGADLVLLADCAAAAYPALHADLLPGKAVVMGCPKFDNIDEHIERLTQILVRAEPKSFTVAYMEVPCCRGFVFAAQKALERSALSIPLKLLEIERGGTIKNRGGDKPLAAIS